MNVLHFKSIANISVCSTAQSYLSILTHCFLSTKTELVSPHTERPPSRRFASVKGECLTTCNVPHACRPLYGEFLHAHGGNPAVGLYTRWGPQKRTLPKFWAFISGMRYLSFRPYLPTTHCVFKTCNITIVFFFLVKMSNFLLKCIQVPFQLKVYKFEHELKKLSLTKYV
jgi:hypothetical protein